MTAHGTETFRPYVKPPSFPKDAFSTLSFNDSIKKWELKDEKKNVV